MGPTQSPTQWVLRFSPQWQRGGRVELTLNINAKVKYVWSCTSTHPTGTTLRLPLRPWNFVYSMSPSYKCHVLKL